MATDAVQESWERTLEERPEFARRVETGPAYRACLERDNREAYQRLLAREAKMSPPYVHGVKQMSDNPMSDNPMSDKMSDKIVRQPVCVSCDKEWTGRGPVCWTCQKRKQRG